jgi:hypothetical protein
LPEWCAAFQALAILSHDAREHRRHADLHSRGIQLKTRTASPPKITIEPMMTKPIPMRCR